jgi:hypothetical protein
VWIVVAAWVNLGLSLRRPHFTPTFVALAAQLTNSTPETQLVVPNSDYSFDQGKSSLHRHESITSTVISISESNSRGSPSTELSRGNPLTE